MEKLPPYIDMKNTKDFNGSFFEDAIKSWINKFKKAEKTELFCIVSEEGKESFVNLLDKVGCKYKYGGFITDFQNKDELPFPLHIEGEIFKLFF